MRAHLDRCRPCFDHARFEENFLRHAGELRPRSAAPARCGPGSSRLLRAEAERRLTPVPCATAALVAAAVAALAWRAPDPHRRRRPGRLAVGHARLVGHRLARRRGAGRLLRFQQPGLPLRAGRSPASTPRASRRDAWQVLRQRRRRRRSPRCSAPPTRQLALWLVTASLAAAAADTWATSLGRRSRIAPRALLVRTRGAAGHQRRSDAAGIAARPLVGAALVAGDRGGRRRTAGALPGRGTLDRFPGDGRWIPRSARRCRAAFTAPPATCPASGGCIAAGPGRSTGRLRMARQRRSELRRDRSRPARSPGPRGPGAVPVPDRGRGRRPPPPGTRWPRVSPLA